jgi:ankyrin repeat protein
VSHLVGLLLASLVALLSPRAGSPQVPPGPDEMQAYTGLHGAVARSDATEIRRLLASGADPGARDGHGRTPLHVAAFGAQAEAMRALVAGGADPNALDVQRYDVVTIAAVRDDVATLRLALALGASPRTVTSPYDGTALIAAAHLGHVEVVRVLVEAGAPLDHVNNLGWTALLEAVILGDGGPRHVAVVRLLVAAGAAGDLADRQGVTPLAHARARGYAEMARILEGARRR